MKPWLVVKGSTLEKTARSIVDTDIVRWGSQSERKRLTYIRERSKTLSGPCLGQTACYFATSTEPL